MSAHCCDVRVNKLCGLVQCVYKINRVTRQGDPQKIDIGLILHAFYFIVLYYYVAIFGFVVIRHPL